MQFLATVFLCLYGKYQLLFNKRSFKGTFLLQFHSNVLLHFWGSYIKIVEEMISLILKSRLRRYLNQIYFTAWDFFEWVGMKSPILDFKNRMEERYTQLQNDKKWFKSKLDRYLLETFLRIFEQTTFKGK